MSDDAILSASSGAASLGEAPLDFVRRRVAHRATATEKFLVPKLYLGTLPCLGSCASGDPGARLLRRAKRSFDDNFRSQVQLGNEADEAELGNEAETARALNRCSDGALSPLFGEAPLSTRAAIRQLQDRDYSAFPGYPA